MFSGLYNRLCGWLLIAFAIVGFLFGQIGDYLILSDTENIVSLCIGIAAVFGARVRKRYSVALAALVGFFLLVWGIWGIFWPGLVFGSSEPLENAIRVVMGAWGVYVAVQDILVWRNS